VLAVDGSSGSDAPTATRPALILEGDYSAEPFATIQAAIDAVPQTAAYSVTINVAAGDYQGFDLKGIQCGRGNFSVLGAQGPVTPTTGPASGTASSGSVNSLTLTGAGWTPDDFVGKFCKIVSGQGAGQHFIIATNTADTLTFAARMSPAPNNTSVFEITEPTTRLTTNGGFYSGVYNTGCTGYFYVYDFHIEGPSYGVVQLGTPSSLSLARVTAKGCYYGFVGQDSYKAAWNQIGAINSGWGGILYLNMGMAGNTGYEKGWLSVNAAQEGIWVSGCKVGGCQGVYSKGSGNNGIYLIESNATYYYAVLDDNLDGLWCSASRAFMYHCSASNNTKRGIGSDYGGRVDASGSLVGSGNGEWGVHAGVGVGGLVTLTMLPTITGTNGDCTVNGSDALAWATDFDEVNEYAYNLERDARIVRAA